MWRGGGMLDAAGAGGGEVLSQIQKEGKASEGNGMTAQYTLSRRR